MTNLFDLYVSQVYGMNKFAIFQKISPQPSPAPSFSPQLIFENFSLIPLIDYDKIDRLDRH